jgi:hypothetical protein
MALAKNLIFCLVVLFEIVSYADQVSYQLLQNMYNTYPATGSLKDKSILEANSKQLEKYFDSNLSRLVSKDIQCSKKQGVCKLDFDPIYASQDPEIKSIKMIDNQTTIDVSLFYFGQNCPIKIIYFFDKKEGKIHDIKYPDGLTLLRILK